MRERDILTVLVVWSFLGGLLPGRTKGSCYGKGTRILDRHIGRRTPSQIGTSACGSEWKKEKDSMAELAAGKS